MFSLSRRSDSHGSMPLSSPTSPARLEKCFAGGGMAAAPPPVVRQSSDMDGHYSAGCGAQAPHEGCELARCRHTRPPAIGASATTSPSSQDRMSFPHHSLVRRPRDRPWRAGSSADKLQVRGAAMQEPVLAPPPTFLCVCARHASARLCCWLLAAGTDHPPDVLGGRS